MKIDDDPVACQPRRSPPASRRAAAVPTAGSRRGATRLDLSVISPTGATLSGVVVEVDGVERVSDANGRILVPAVAVAAGGTLVARMITADDTLQVARAAVMSPMAPAVPQSSGGVPQPNSAPPVVTEAPSYPTRDAPVTLRGGGFGADPEELEVRLGDKPLNVLSASPTELAAQLPDNAPLGSQALIVRTARGESTPATVTLVALRLTSEATTIRRGRKGKATIRAYGTSKPLRLAVANLSSEVIALAGGETQVITTSGGSDNQVRIEYRGMSPGSFQITASVLDEEPASLSRSR